jgi:branched-subunit amino acid transport protein
MSQDIPIQKIEFKMEIIIIIIIITVLNRVLFFQLFEMKNLASFSQKISQIVDLH